MIEKLINAVIFGVVQGLTEFLPVSSSGHLELAKFILGYDAAANQSMLMTVVLHFATALSTVVVFRREIGEIISGLFQFQLNESFFFSLKILISMIPAAIIGVLFDEQIESLFDQQITLVGFMLIVTGILLFFADRAKDTGKEVNFASSLWIGISQAVAILPGISRSGATISTSVLLGIDRAKSAKFSFLMVVPLIFAKIAKDLLDGEFGASSFGSDDWLPLIIGFMAAFVTGLAACLWMIQLVKKCQLYYFSIYCFVVGTCAILYGLDLFSVAEPITN